jgi:hypothetical protein
MGGESEGKEHETSNIEYQKWTERLRDGKSKGRMTFA